MNNIGEAVTRISASVLLSAATAAYWYRPVPNELTRTDVPCRNGLMSRINFSENCNRNSPIMLSVARHFTILITVSFSQFVLLFGGNFRVRKDDNLKNLVKAITSRPKGVPLITVSNHRSVADEPILLAGLMPWYVGVQPRFLRWSICTQHICFQNGDLLSAFFGAGKTLPLVRGHGIDQKLLLDFARHLAAGDWGHVFPEGGCWQRPRSLGGRHNGARTGVGNLKWGVGKLIAHSPVSPIVIPFYHMGMEHFVRQDVESRDILVSFPTLVGHRVSAVVGPELHFEDLIEEHERVHGPLWKYSSSTDSDIAKSGNVTADGNLNFHVVWDSRPEDLDLYHKITLRIEDALHLLNDLCLQELSELVKP